MSLYLLTRPRQAVKTPFINAEFQCGLVAHDGGLLPHQDATNVSATICLPDLFCSAPYLLYALRSDE